jgi:hypothetical protein
MSLFGTWANANNNQQQQQQPNAFGQPSSFGQPAQPASGKFESIAHKKNRADFDISTTLYWLVFLVGFGGFASQPQQPQQPGFAPSQPQNTFGGEAHIL